MWASYRYYLTDKKADTKDGFFEMFGISWAPFKKE
jgi:hypothetical protein